MSTFLLQYPHSACILSSVAPRKRQNDSLDSQTSVRLSLDDEKMLKELAEKTRRPKTELFRYALRYYHRRASESQWDLNISGEPRESSAPTPVAVSPSPPETAPPRAKVTPR